MDSASDVVTGAATATICVGMAILLPAAAVVRLWQWLKARRR